MSRTAYSLNSYTGGAGAAYITGSGIGATDTTITITGTTTGWNPLGTTGGWYLSLDYGTANEEKVFVPSGTYAWSSGLVTISGITRGIDETNAVVHSGGGAPNGVICTPVLTSLDTSEANAVASLIFYPSGMIDFPQSINVSGSIGAPSPPYDLVTTSGQISAGNTTFSDWNQLASFVSSGNNYNQVIAQNTTSGTSASSSFVAANNIATSGIYFAEFGINSNAFTGAGVFNEPNAGFLAVASGDLGVGNYFGGNIRFVVSGMGSAPVDSLVISGTGQAWSNNWSSHASMPASYVAPYQAWTYDPIMASSTITLVTGTAYYSAIWIPQPMTISGISFAATTWAATAIVYMGLFSNTTQLATCSGRVGGATGFQKMLISGSNYQVTSPGLYYVGIVVSGSSALVLQCPPAASTAAVLNLNINPANNSVTGLRSGDVVIGQRALYGTGGAISGTITPITQVPFFALS